MPHPSVYYGKTGQCYTPQSFTENFNQYVTLTEASLAMGISNTRLSVIATRLRKRGFPVRHHGKLTSLIHEKIQ